MRIKEKIRILLSGFLAVIFLFSTFSFTANQHYCGKMLMETSLFNSAKDCCKVSHSDLKKINDLSHCCSNRQVKINGQKELKDQVSNSINAELVVFPEIYQFRPSLKITGNPTKSKIIQNFHPPGAERDLYIFHESFLI